MKLAHSEGVRRTLANAQNAAAQDLHRFVHTEHLLIGFLEERSSGTAVLKSLGFNRETLKQTCQAKCHRGNSTMEDNLKLTSRVQEILAYAGEECKKLEDEKIDTRHILLGIIREDGGIAGSVLRESGLTYEKAFRASVTYATSHEKEGAHEHTEKRTRKKSYESRPFWRRMLGV